MNGPKTDWLSSAPSSPTNAKADTPLFPYLLRLMRGEDLSYREAAAFFSALTDPGAFPRQMSVALAVLTAKGETGEELGGMASIMRANAAKVGSAKRNAVDIAGTGSSAAKTFNVSTAAALVAAGAGLSIAKQSNKGSSTPMGSSELLAELGVKVATEPKAVETALSGTGVCFISAAKFHPTLRRLSEIRSSLGIRTCLNLLGLLANPVTVDRHLLGVWHRSMVEPVGKALSLLKAKRAWVVRGDDGLDEITLSRDTLVCEVTGGSTKLFTVSPKDFGLKPGKIDHLRASSVKESAAIIRDVLASKRRDEARSLVVLNAAAALIVGDLAKDPMHAARLAEQSIDSGQAQNKLERLIQASSRRTPIQP